MKPWIYWEGIKLQSPLSSFGVMPVLMIKGLRNLGCIMGLVDLRVSVGMSSIKACPVLLVMENVLI